MENQETMLGPSEQFVAKRLKDAIEGCAAGAKKRYETFEKVDVSLIEEVLLDHKKKEGAIGTLEMLEQLKSNLGTAYLIAVITEVQFKEK